MKMTVISGKGFVAEFSPGGRLRKIHLLAKTDADRRMSPGFQNVHIRKSEKEAKSMTMTERVEKSHRMQTVLSDAIDAYAAKHGVSKSIAADKVLLSPVVSEMVVLEKRERALMKDAYGSGGGYRPTDDKRRGDPALPGSLLPVKSSAEILEELAQAAMRGDPSLTHAQAVNRASNSPMFTEAMGRERAARAMAQAAAGA
jgi:hypothetical protein